MIKVRIMPTLLFKDYGLVKGVGFDSWRPVGSAMQAVKVYNLREVDELVFLDITANALSRPPDYSTIEHLASECFMPLAVGGGIRSVQDVRTLLQTGADKVVINTAAIENPNLIRQIADRFGTQCVVVSIDVKKSTNGKYDIYSHSGTKLTKLNLISWAQEIEKFGAGEILLTSIDRDGTMKGYDIDLIQQVTQSVSIPVIASGGAGSYAHMHEAIVHGKASAVAAASIFHFTEQTPIEAKQYLAKKGIAVRL